MTENITTFENNYDNDNHDYNITDTQEPDITSYVDDYGDTVSINNDYDNDYTELLTNSIIKNIDDQIQQSNYETEQSITALEKKDRLARAAELKRNEIYRKAPLKYEQDGSLINDSDAMIRAKTYANKVIHATDWLLEATENIADFGQGDWIDHSNDFLIERNGRLYDANNKDFIGAEDITRQDLIDQYLTAEDDPNAQNVVYYLRKFDGYNPDGSTKYIYKVGTDRISAYGRNKDQYIKDGYEIVSEKRFAGAENWENLWHSLDENLNHRVVDYGIVLTPDGRMNRDKASRINYGTGYTELYDSDLLGLDTGSKEDYAKNLDRSKLMYQQYMQRPKDSNFIDAIQASTLGLVTGTADAVLDLFTPGDNTLLNDYNQEWADKVAGYDRHYGASKVNEADAAFRRGDILTGLFDAVQAAPSFIGESLPYMAAMSVGAGEVAGTARALKLVNAVSEAKKAGSTTEEIANLIAKTKKTMNHKELKVYDTFKDSENTLKALNLIAKGAGVEAVNLELTNQIINERMKAKKAAGQDPTVSAGEAVALYMSQLPFTLLDKVAFDDIINVKGISKALKSAINKTSNATKKEFTTRLLDKSRSFLTSATEEGLQEYVQQWGQLIGEQYGIDNKDVMDILKDTKNQLEARQAAIAGAAAGIGMHTVPASISGSKAFTNALFNHIAQKRKIKNLENIVNNLDDDQFEFYINNEQNDIDTSKANTELMNDTKIVLKRAKSVDEMIESSIPEVKSFGEHLRDIAIYEAFKDDKFNNYIADSIRNNISASISPEIIVLLDTNMVQKAINNDDVKDKITDDDYRKRLAKAYLNAPLDLKIKVIKQDAVSNNEETKLIDNNNNPFHEHSRNNDLYNKFIKPNEKKVFEESKDLIDNQIVSIDNKIKEYNNKIKDREERLYNHKLARQEAIATGSGVKLFNNEDINVNEFNEDPKGFINKIKSFGTKSKIIDNIKNYSDEALERAYNHPDASLAVKKAIDNVLNIRVKTRTKLANIETELEPGEYKIRLVSNSVRHSNKVLNNVKNEINKKKNYKYYNELEDHLIAANSAYTLGRINENEYENILSDIAVKLMDSLSNNEQKTKLSKSIVELYDVFSDSNLPLYRKNKVMQSMLAKFGQNTLKSAKDKDIFSNDLKLLERFNQKAFNTIMNNAKKTSIDTKEEKKHILKMIDIAEKVGDITSKQADVFRKRIEIISKNSRNTTDKENRNKYKTKKTLLTSKKVNKLIESNRNKQILTKAYIKDLDYKYTQEDLTSEEKAKREKLVNKLEALKKQNKEIIDFSTSEQLSNESFDEIFDIIEEVDEESKEEVKFLFNLCLKKL